MTCSYFCGDFRDGWQSGLHKLLMLSEANIIRLHGIVCRLFHMPVGDSYAIALQVERVIGGDNGSIRGDHDRYFSRHKMDSA